MLMYSCTQGDLRVCLPPHSHHPIYLPKLLALASWFIHKHLSLGQTFCSLRALPQPPFPILEEERGLLL